MFPYVAKKVKDVISVKKIVNCFHIILSDSKNGALKKMLSGVNVEGLKKKLQSSSKEEIDGFMGVLSKLDPALIKKIKDSLN